MPKRTMVAVGTTVVLLLAALFISLYLPPPADITLNFVGYTNDFLGARGFLYRLPPTSSNSMAVLRLENRTGKTIEWGEPMIMLKSGRRFVLDTNQILNMKEMGYSPLSAGDTKKIFIPKPSVPVGWNCTIIIRSSNASQPPKSGFVQFVRRVRFRLGLSRELDGISFITTSEIAP